MKAKRRPAERNPARTRIRLIAVLIALQSAADCVAGDAVFTNDGQHVYAIGYADNKQVLREINLTEQTSRTISLSQLPPQQPVLGITRSDGDKLFCVTEKNIWTFDPANNRLTKVCGAPKDGRYWRIAYDPQSHTVVVTGSGEKGPLFLYKNGLISVYLRRYDSISSPVFAADGTFFYSQVGDLWSGKIESNEGTYSLTADRYLPLAYLETANTTPAGMGVSDIAPVKVKPLGENDRPACLCASPDETRVYYTKDDKDYLITNGQIAELHLTKAAATANAQVSSTEPAAIATDVTPPSDTDIQYGIDVVQKQIAAMSLAISIR